MTLYQNYIFYREAYRAVMEALCKSHSPRAAKSAANMREKALAYYKAMKKKEEMDKRRD